MRAFTQPIVLLFGVIACLPMRAEAKDWEFVATQGLMKIVVIEKQREGSRETYQDAIDHLCQPNKYCLLNFWSEKNFVPKKFPMSDAEADAKVAQFIRNPNTNFEQFLWNCRIRNDPKECFR